MNDKQWVVRASREDVAQSETNEYISRELGVTAVTAQLLVNRGYSDPSSAKLFLSKGTELLHDPFLMKDMDRAVTRILRALDRDEKIAVYGDYDVDGITSTASLLLYLRSKGADVTPYIPSRTGDGYGISESALRRLAAEGVTLIISVDTGITAVREVELARDMNVSLVITDHHECPDELPQADAVVDPHRADDSYPFKELAGVGVTFKLLCAIESRLNPSDSMASCVRRISLSYMDLVAIGTVADVMPIRDENRLIVSFGLSRIEREPRIGVDALLYAANGETKKGVKRKITSSLIGFTLAPRLNAAGRLHDASLALELFLTEDIDRAESVARRLCDMNRERQNEENKILASIYEKIDATHDFEKYPVLVLADDTWHHGIIGIVASRITEKYGCPSILISFADPAEGQGTGGISEIGKGSARSVKGVNLAEALVFCDSLLEKHGGHELAAGLSIRREQLNAFTERVNEFARAALPDGLPPQTLSIDCELSPEDICLEQAEELFDLEPFGTGNPTPSFAAYDWTLTDLTAVGLGKHIRMRLERDGVSVTAMLFRHTLSDIDVYPGDRLDVAFQMDINEFRGLSSVQFILKDIRLAADIREAEAAERAVYDQLMHAYKGAERGTLEPTLLPTYREFGEAYKTLRRELLLGHEVYSLRALADLFRESGTPLSYTKIRIILDVFCELGFFTQLRPDERDVVCLSYIPSQAKTSLDNSKLLCDLKAFFAIGEEAAQ